MLSFRCRRCPSLDDREKTESSFDGNDRNIGLHTAGRQLYQTSFTAFFFQVPEYILAIAFHGTGWAFTYLIKVSREEHHELITHGVHRFASHPSYCGFHIPSVGTQTMLCNPMSTIGPAIVYFLRQFFGLRYEEYAWRVPSAISEVIIYEFGGQVCFFFFSLSI
ncbi:protein-S-isoprenylcysteine O-methyltransferase A [Citrus sinensis]|nr:protein-S-isoprenylcysteine O-methyltransferase A [Citrus sinensis]